SLMIGLDEALQRSGAGLRQRLLEGEQPPAAVPDGVLEEAFRRWLPELEAVEQRLAQGGAELLASAESVADALAERPGRRTAPPRPARAAALGEPGLPGAASGKAPAAGRAGPGAADGPQARLGEDGPALSPVLVAGLGWGLWLQGRLRREQRQR